MTRGERTGGWPWPPTTQAAIVAVLASILPFSFFCFCPLCRQPWPRLHLILPFLFVVLQLHIRIGTIACILFVWYQAYCMLWLPRLAKQFLSHPPILKAPLLSLDIISLVSSHQQLDHRLVP